MMKKLLPLAARLVLVLVAVQAASTVTALMMLVDEGKVSLADPVEKYLPEFKGQMLALDSAWRADEGKKMLSAFQQAALAAFGKPAAPGQH